MDGPHRLSSVTFSDGSEIKRSFADGLIGVEESKISFTQPRPCRLVPFLQEERDSYARNFADRPAEELNLEVIPMYDNTCVSA